MSIERYKEFIDTVDGKILLGCDGFVDEVYEIVEVRQNLNEFKPMSDMGSFGELVSKRAGGGLGLEIVGKRRCSGGFTPNTGRVGAFLGLRPCLMGLYGETAIDSAFEEFHDNSELISLGDPALTVVLEFSNGKVLLSALKTVAHLTWADCQASLGEEKLDALFAGVDILGLGYWSLTPDFDEFVKGFVGRYDTGRTPKRMFFDLADVNKRSHESLVESLELLRSVNRTIPCTISFNEHEGAELFSRHGMESVEEPRQMAADLARLRDKLEVDELVIHTPEFAVASHATEGEAFAMQEFQTNVIRTAGAGDSFNGGYLCASLGQLSLKERLVIANATTSFFVTHATAPTKEQLLAQIEKARDK